MRDVKHPFYELTKEKQNRFLLRVAMIALIFNVLVILLSIRFELYFIPVFSISATFSVIAPFFDVPSLVKSGRLVYYSPLFLAEKEKNGVITIHGGTLFDYYFILNRSLNGRERTRFILRNYLEGILNLIEKYEGRNESVVIRGTSYILNERTAQRVGFHKVEKDFIQTILLFYNYINLTLSFSLSKAGLHFPNIKNINTYEANIDDVIKRKNYLNALYKRFETRVSAR